MKNGARSAQKARGARKRRTERAERAAGYLTDDEYMSNCEVRSYRVQGGKWQHPPRPSRSALSGGATAGGSMS